MNETEILDIVPSPFKTIDEGLDSGRVRFHKSEAAACLGSVERVMGFEPTAPCLGSKHSTAELHPLKVNLIKQGSLVKRS